ncbi:nascent polypeptide-associated complex subunit alpha, muscle-specific form-like [Sapajus apella]|uniref:Nascent polypeptide-associated complex subunit alpha, muscle-specific form-like n=1 Tax=Sapajus apella TaxID=9515 RepID=A0A6J3HSE8_SAPAP|nr:nascent polypeptide-associated complex subunit alpha, muscle-specific form-like [Sapajus apella]
MTTTASHDCSVSGSANVAQLDVRQCGPASGSTTISACTISTVRIAYSTYDQIVLRPVRGPDHGASCFKICHYVEREPIRKLQVPSRGKERRWVGRVTRPVQSSLGGRRRKRIILRDRLSWGWRRRARETAQVTAASPAPGYRRLGGPQVGLKNTNGHPGRVTTRGTDPTRAPQGSRAVDRPGKPLFLRQTEDRSSPTPPFMRQKSCPRAQADSLPARRGAWHTRGLLTTPPALPHPGLSRSPLTAPAEAAAAEAGLGDVRPPARLPVGLAATAPRPPPACSPLPPAPPPPSPAAAATAAGSVTSSPAGPSLPHCAWAGTEDPPLEREGAGRQEGGHAHSGADLPGRAPADCRNLRLQQPSPAAAASSCRLQAAAADPTAGGAGRGKIRPPWSPRMGSSERERQGGTPGKSLGGCVLLLPKLGVRTTPCRPHGPDGQGGRRSARRANQVALEELSMVSPSKRHRVPSLSIWVGSRRKTNACSETVLSSVPFLVCSGGHRVLSKSAQVYSVESGKSQTTISRLSPTKHGCREATTATAVVATNG